MSATPDRAVLKQAIHAKMMALEEAELATAIAHYEAYLKEAQLDRSESHDTDEIADAREARDLAAAFDHPVQAHHAKIDVLENLDFGPSETIQPGAVVSFNGRNFVVAVSTTRFDVDGQTYMGISTQSPIYQAMKGLAVGDTFSFNGREIKVQDVL